ncbi:T9SS type B sorting domain-containing protein [Croceibacter atlanticus]|uniref:T9SS type B sorting domain-containing protein n=1 Tax=Croceibacter atlanticus TaxID=313588 RepID=UPI0030DDC41C
MKKYILILCSLFLGVTLHAQGEANNWYFGGNAGVTFNTTPPSALTDGRLVTTEGCSTISDVNGNLQFYSDGRSVWNRNHQKMSNGDYNTGQGLLGDPSSTSSALIVPHPGLDGIYYIFAVDEPHHDNAAAFPGQGPALQNGNPTGDGNYTDVNDGVPNIDDGFNNGFTYSVVDMSLNNGLGDVVASEKNIQLETFNPNFNNQAKFKCSEKVTAVRGAVCGEVWVITHFINKFYAFKVDSSGLDTTPVISEVGPAVTTSNYRRAALGYMKASPDGNRIAVAHNTFTYFPPNVSDEGDGGVYLYDFDRNTGVVSNNQELYQGASAYGVEFSANSERLFASMSSPELFSTLHQWDLTAANIPNSRVELFGPSGGGSLFSMQLAPNGKIYVSSFGSNNLMVINNPEELGNDVNFATDVSGGAINLQGGEARLGLPPFIQSFLTSKVNIINNTASTDDTEEHLELCESDNYTLVTENIPGVNYVWYKDDVLIAGETDNTLQISRPNNGETLPYTENYRLEIDLNNGDCPLFGVAEVTYYETPEATMPMDISLCDEDNDGQEQYNLGAQNAEILTGQTNPNFLVTYHSNQADAENGLNPINTNYTVSESLQTIYARVENTNNRNCFDTTSFEIELFSISQFGDDEEIIYCLEDLPEPVQLNSGIPVSEIQDYSFVWQPSNETTPSISTTELVTHTVTITNTITGCSYEKSFTITASNQAQNITFEISDFSEQNTIIVNLGSESVGDYEFALNSESGPYQDDPTFTNVPPGFYDIFVRDKNGCGVSARLDIGVLGFMTFFTPNADGFNDVWRLVGVSRQREANARVNIFDRYGKLLKSFAAGTGSWNGNFNGNPMPSGDYWFQIILEDGTQYRSNFTLKR